MAKKKTKVKKRAGISKKIDSAVVKGLIIAAGQGSRIAEFTKNKEIPKPLLKFLGLPLIERNIILLKKAGIDEIIIVIGYKGDKVKKYLGDGRKHEVKIRYIENKEYEKGNGISVLKAESVLKENFVLLMADHIFDFEMISNLVNRNIKEGCVLAVDKNLKSHISLDDATKVKEKNGKIIGMGKNIQKFNCIDTGAFLCTPDIFYAIKKSVENGGDTLTAGVKILAKKGSAKVLDIGNKLWFDIDTKDDYKRAENIIYKNLTKKTDGIVSKYLNRPISIKMSKFLVKTPITPNVFAGCTTKGELYFIELKTTKEKNKYNNDFNNIELFT